MRWRVACWCAGVVTLVVALVGTGSGYSGHMVEHVLLTVVAPPLLVIGGPYRLAPRASARVLRRLRFLVWPPLAFVMFTAAMLVTHLTGVWDYALAHPWAHGLEHAVLFWTAVAFWVPVAAAPPAPRRLRPIARIAYLLLAMAPMGAIGAVLMNRGPAADADAGAAMWVGGGYVLVLATVIAAWESLEAEERRQRLREKYE
jgi:putative membrane protein